MALLTPRPACAPGTRHDQLCLFLHTFPNGERSQPAGNQPASPFVGLPSSRLASEQAEFPFLRWERDVPRTQCCMYFPSWSCSHPVCFFDRHLHLTNFTRSGDSLVPRSHRELTGCCPPCVVDCCHDSFNGRNETLKLERPRQHSFTDANLT